MIIKFLFIWEGGSCRVHITMSVKGFWGILVSHNNDIIMGAIASQITSLTIVYSIIYSDADQRKHQSSASLAFVRGIHRGPVNSLHKWPVTRKMFPFDDVIMKSHTWWHHDMDALSALLPYCEGNNQSPHIGPMLHRFHVFFILAWTNRWRNSSVTGDFRSLNPQVMSL